MSDPYVAALREYDRAVGPAHELIRRARARLRSRLDATAAAPPGAEDVGWAATANPDEPNGAELAVEAALSAIEQPEQGVVTVVGPVESPAPVSQPRAAGRTSGSPPAAASSPSAADSREAGDSAAEDRMPQAAAGIGTPVESSPAASSLEQPPAGGERPSPRAGRRVGQAARTRSPAVSPRGPRAGAVERATCPDCRREVTARGLGVHSRHAHGYRATAKGKKPASAKPGAGVPPTRPTGRETFLCRCGASFDSASARGQHEARMHPAEPLMSHRPVGRVAARGREADAVIHPGARLGE